MFKLCRYPFFGKSFFRRARKIVGTCQFAHLWRIVVALASLQGHSSLCKIEERSGRRRSRQAISHFLTSTEWDAPEVLRATALDILRQLGYRAGDRLYVILDDTQVEKFGKRMDAVQKIFLHAQQRYARGHTVVGCALSYRGVVIPYSLEVWTPEDFPDHPFRKLTVLGADLIRNLTLPGLALPEKAGKDRTKRLEKGRCGKKGRPGNGHLTVLFDAYYLCPPVTNVCRERKFHFISVARRNRRFQPDGRPWDSRRLQQYGANVLAHEGQRIKVQGNSYRMAQRIGQLRKAGRVKLVFDRRGREARWRTLVTDHVKWSPKTILSHYLARWSIEVLFKMTKQYLGLGDYHLLRYTGVVRYLHLVLIAYLLLTHLALHKPDAKAELQNDEMLCLASIPHLQCFLRQQLFQDGISSLENSRRYHLAARKIKQLIQF